MKVDSVRTQLEAAATRAGLIAMFGPLTFGEGDVEALGACGEGEECEVGFGSDVLMLGVMFVEVYDSGSPEDGGLTVGLRGWRLDPEIAAV